MTPDSTQHGLAAGDDKRGEGDAPATPPARRHRTARRAGGLALLVAVTYVLYQRIGTTAQADEIEFTTNLAGGFLAVGMTDTAPGFIVLSALDREHVDVDARCYSNAIAGDFTIAEVRTPQMTWRGRLRGPVVVLVDANGVAQEFAIGWSAAQFALVRDEADCDHGHIGKRHRCGAPFADLFDLVADGRLGQVLPQVRQFLAPYARPRDGHTERVQSNENARATLAGLGGG